MQLKCIIILIITWIQKCQPFSFILLIGFVIFYWFSKLFSRRRTAVLGAGISTQAGAGVMAKALAAATSPPKQTYFERLLWNQASQEAAASVTGKPAR